MLVERHFNFKRQISAILMILPSKIMLFTLQKGALNELSSLANEKKLLVTYFKLSKEVTYKSPVSVIVRLYIFL